MANTSRINGFRPVKYLNGSPWTGQARKYVVPAANGTALYIGDPVKLEASGDSETGLQTCVIGTAGAAILGFVVGIEPNGGTSLGGDMSTGPVSLDTPVYRVASTRRIVYVVDDPNVIFEAEMSNGTLTTADVGLNASFAIGSPSSTTGASGAYVDAGTEATTAALELKIVGFVRRPDNEYNSTGVASGRVLVKINNSQLAASTGTAGV